MKLTVESEKFSIDADGLDTVALVMVMAVISLMGNVT